MATHAIDDLTRIDALLEFASEATSAASGRASFQRPAAHGHSQQRSIPVPTRMAAYPVRDRITRSLVPFACGLALGALGVLTGVPAGASGARMLFGPSTVAPLAVRKDSVPALKREPQTHIAAVTSPALPAVAAATAPDVSPSPRSVQSATTRSARRTTAFRGTLAVTSQPQGAAVYVNGRRSGTTPVLLSDLPAGSRAVRVELSGYQPWSSSVRVVTDQRTAVIAPLAPVTSPH